MIHTDSHSGLFFLFIFALLYSLVIGRASVVSSAPLAVLSLLPSILLSIAAWIMRSTLLENNEHDDTTDNDTDGKSSIQRAEGDDSPNEDTVYENQHKQDMSEKWDENTSPDKEATQHDTESTEDNRKENQRSNHKGSTIQIATSLELAEMGEGCIESAQEWSDINRYPGETERNIETERFTEI